MKTHMIAAAAVLAAGAALAGTSFSYQGALRDGNGGALTATDHKITFRLYEDPTEGEVLWERQVAVHLDGDGLFNVELSDGVSPAPQGLTNSLDDVLASTRGEGLYIGLYVEDSSGEIRPRQKLLPVPVSSFAQDVREARNDFTVNGTATFDRKVVAKGDLSVEGTAAVRQLTVDGDGATVYGQLKVGGNLELGKESTVRVNGSPLLPAGVIVMWSGAATNVPPGWCLCDGGNGTPDLRDRFVVGAGRAYGVNATGGSSNVVLTVSNLPPHHHSYSFKTYDLAAAWKNQRNFFSVDHGGDNTMRSRDTADTGDGVPHENRPPYYALCYIMKL